MSSFHIYFKIGFDHIVSLAGFDHLLFIIVLCAVYARQDWRRILVLLTGFTLGHSLTLALTALRLISISPKTVELLIPATILVTSFLNLYRLRSTVPVQAHFQIPAAILFGLIHGCGFAGYFSMMLGEEQSIVGPLFAFNVGLEAGQVVTVIVFYADFFLLEKLFPLRQRDWTIFVSGAGAGLAITMILENLVRL